MKNNYFISLFFSLLLACNFVSFYGLANSISVSEDGKILIENAFVRATIPGTSISSAYMEIENKSAATITLISINSKASSRIEIHQHTMLDGMMRMRKLDTIDIKPKERVKLQPSGLHLMLFNVAPPLKAQENIELILSFSNKQSIAMQLPVYSPEQEKKAAQEMSPTMHEHYH